MSKIKLQSKGPLYSNTVIGTLAVDVPIAVPNVTTFGTASRGLQGGAAARPVPSSLYQM